MSLNDNFPFNYKPTSVTVSTGNITIPANQYAYVTVHATSGETFSINGTQALSSINKGSWSRTSVTSGNYVVPSDSIAHIAFSTVTGSTPSDVQLDVIDVAGDYGIAGSDKPVQINNIAPGTTIRSQGSGPTVYISLEPIVKDVTTVTANFWVGPNDALTGNARKTVTYYQIP